MSPRLYLIRHAETEWPLAGPHRPHGHGDEPSRPEVPVITPWNSS